MGESRDRSLLHRPFVRGAAACAVLLWLAAPYWAGTVDDVYISVGFARTWAETGALTWVDGARVEGYSSPLWVAALALGILAGADPGLLAQQMALFFGCSLLVLLSARLPRSGSGTLALFAVSCWAPLTYWSVVGMETTAYAALLAVGWTGIASGRRWALWAVLLASLTRPEGAVQLVAAGAVLLVTDEERRRACRTLLVVGGFFAVYHGARVAWFGDLLATSTLVKIGAVGWSLGGVFQGAGAFASALGASLAVILACRPDRRGWWWAAIPLGIQAAVLVRAGGDWMAHGRLLLPGVVAAMAVLAGCARPGAGDTRRGWVAGVAVLVVVGAVWMPVGFRDTDGLVRESWCLTTPWSPYQLGLATPFSEDLDWIVTRIPDGGWVILSDVGMLSGVPGVGIIDTGGLVHRDMAVARARSSEAKQMRAEIGELGSAPAVIRVGDQSVDWADLPDWLIRSFPPLERTAIGDRYTQWFGTVGISPSPLRVSERWKVLAQRNPSHPALRFAHARALLRAGDAASAEDVLRVASGRWPGNAAFADGLRSVSFGGGELPLEYIAGRGFALYRNGEISSVPVPSELVERAYLVLDVDLSGEEPVRVRVEVLGSCEQKAREVPIRTRYELDLGELGCSPSAEPVVSVRLLNDKSNLEGDRNVFASIRY